MRKLNLVLVALFATASLTTMQSCNSADKKASGSEGKVLKFNLEKGKGYDYEMIWDMDQKVMGQDSKIRVSGLYSINVIDDDGNLKTVTGTYRSFRMYMKMMGMEIDVDTDKPADNSAEQMDLQTNPSGIMTKVFRGIVGKSFTMKINKEGSVTEVKGFDEILTGMIDSVGLPEAQKAQMEAALKDQFNEQNVKDQFAQVFNLFPNKEIKVGDSWEKEHSTGGKMPSKHKTTYTVKEINGDNVTLDSKTTISGASDMDINGTQTGTIQIDSKTGLMTNGEYEQKIKVVTQNITVEMDGKGKIKGRPA